MGAKVCYPPMFYTEKGTLRKGKDWAEKRKIYRELKGEEHAKRKRVKRVKAVKKSPKKSPAKPKGPKVMKESSIKYPASFYTTKGKLKKGKNWATRRRNWRAANNIKLKVGKGQDPYKYMSRIGWQGYDRPMNQTLTQELRKAQMAARVPNSRIMYRDQIGSGMMPKPLGQYQKILKKVRRENPGMPFRMQQQMASKIYQMKKR